MTYLCVELPQFLLLARSSRRSFLWTPPSIQQNGTNEWNWHDPDRDSREVCGYLWNMKYFPLTRNERATKLRIADVGRVAALTAGMLLLKLTFSDINYTSLLNCVLPHKIRIQSKCCTSLKLLFSSKFRAHHYHSGFLLLSRIIYKPPCSPSEPLCCLGRVVAI